MGAEVAHQASLARRHARQHTGTERHMEAEAANADCDQMGVLPAEVARTTMLKVYTCPFRLPHEMGATLVCSAVRYNPAPM